METEICGGSYEVLSEYFYHAYVTAEPDIEFHCLLGVDGPNNAPTGSVGQGDPRFAKIICCMDPDDTTRTVYGKLFSSTMCKDSSGVLLGLTGVCHQMANRILHSANILNFPQWWQVPCLFYGLFGKPGHIQGWPALNTKMRNWQEYLAIATILDQAQGEPEAPTEEQVQAMVPEVRAKVLGMTDEYPEWAPLIRMEVEHVDDPALPLMRLGFFLSRAMDEAQAKVVTKTLGPPVESVVRELPRLHREVEKNPELLVASIGKANDLIANAAREFQGALTADQFEKAFGIPAGKTVPVVPIATLQQDQQKLDELYREYLETDRAVSRS